ncbi:E3 Ubiquitin Ligase Traf3Ip2 [Manis pentadactyla]|nr:E3 Ubiquitin Ligase Traf3Ip2 [Manis pentadactyla]
MQSWQLPQQLGQDRMAKGCETHSRTHNSTDWFGNRKALAVIFNRIKRPALSGALRHEFIVVSVTLSTLEKGSDCFHRSSSGPARVWLQRRKHRALGRCGCAVTSWNLTMSKLGTLAFEDNLHPWLLATASGAMTVTGHLVFTLLRG